MSASKSHSLERVRYYPRQLMTAEGHAGRAALLRRALAAPQPVVPWLGDPVRPRSARRRQQRQAVAGLGLSRRRVRPDGRRDSRSRESALRPGAAPGPEDDDCAPCPCPPGTAPGAALAAGKTSVPGHPVRLPASPPGEDGDMRIAAAATAAARPADTVMISS